MLTALWVPSAPQSALGSVPLGAPAGAGKRASASLLPHKQDKLGCTRSLVCSWLACLSADAVFMRTQSSCAAHKPTAFRHDRQPSATTGTPSADSGPPCPQAARQALPHRPPTSGGRVQHHPSGQSVSAAKRPQAASSKRGSVSLYATSEGARTERDLQLNDLPSSGRRPPLSSPNSPSYRAP